MESYLNLAINASIKNKLYPKWPFGAVIVKGGSIRSIGQSKKTNDPKISPEGIRCSEHAEIAALRKAGDVSGAKMFVARTQKSGKTALAKPCDSCMDALKAAGIKTVYYTTEDGYEKERLSVY